MSEQQLNALTTLCIKRCALGDTWPPDLADVLAMALGSGLNPLGLTVSDVLEEYQRWLNKGYQYGTSAEFPWKQPVLFHICTEIRTAGVGKNLTDSALNTLAVKILDKWVKRVEMGLSVPPIRQRIKAPKREGLTPAQQLAAGVRYVK